MRKSFISRRLWLVLSVVALISGVYMLMNALAPYYLPSSPAYAKLQPSEEPTIKENRLHIPKIGVNVAIVEGDSEAVLEKGAWHRQPQHGNPEKGGNFVLSAHRFQLGLTPQQTSAKSPFYHIDQLQLGDTFMVDYNHKRFTYEVVKKYKVDRFALSIEGPSDIPKMTIYTCDLKGEEAGRDVIEAKLQ